VNFLINKKVQLIDLGLIDYKIGWDYQEKLFADDIKIKLANRRVSPQEQKPTSNYLVFCQHAHVYTLGKSGSKENLLMNEEELSSINAVYYKINRGGDITYHGPGQLVCYPIIDLENFFTDIHKYLRTLELAVIDTCHHFGIRAGRIEGLTGVWIDFLDKSKARKICALGVKTSRWVTMHGLALNVSTDLSYFNHIVPCGIEDKSVTSISREIGGKIEIPEAQTVLQEKLIKVFDMDPVEGG